MKGVITMDVVGFGALNVDLIYEIDLASLGIEAGRERKGSYKELENLLRALKNRGKLRSKSGGGSAANTIYALAKMGFSTGYVGKVGRDEEGNFLLRELIGAGVDVSKIQQNEKSGLCIALSDRKGERTILVFPYANDELGYSEVDLDYLNKAKFIHITSFLGDKPFEAQKRVAKETRARISFNPGEPHMRRGIKELTSILEHTFILFSSQREIEMLTKKDYKKGTRALLEYGIKIAVCTLGKRGSYILSEREEELEVPAEKVEIMDATGAGDVYAAGFLAGLLKGFSLSKCASLGTKIACESIMGYGRERYPDAAFLSKINSEG
jgi:ribokinase